MILELILNSGDDSDDFSLNKYCRRNHIYSLLRNFHSDFEKELKNKMSEISPIFPVKPPLESDSGRDTLVEGYSKVDLRSGHSV